MISPPSISAIFVDDAVHELAVVRRHQQRAGQRLEEALEPDDRLDVEVVGRLVHQQDVRPAEQHARHRDAHLPAAGQRADVAVDALVVEAEAVQHLARLRLEAVAAEVLVLLLHLAEAREDRSMSSAWSGSAIACCSASSSWCRSPRRPLPAIASSSTERPRHLLDVLAEVADRQLLRHRDVAFVRRFLADDHPEQRRLAGAVGTDEADLLARIELERGVDEEHLPAVLLADAGEGNHC